MVTAVAETVRERAARGPARVRRAAGDQLLVGAGQAMAGLGNLLFAVAMARVLEPAAFAQVSAFAALYLLVHTPAGSLAAGGALTPDLVPAARRRAVQAGLVVATATGVAAVPAAPWLGLPPDLGLVLAAALPAAAVLALERGRLYGLSQHGGVVATLAVEPAIRLTAGVGLAVVAGPTGAAAGVVLGGYGALWIARRWARGRHIGSRAVLAQATAGAAPRGLVRRNGWTMSAFLLLAVVANQDLLLANRFLGGRAAAGFAVLSTLGGLAAFATATVPLVLLPRAARGDRGAVAAGVGIAALLGAGATAVVAVAGAPLITVAFGARYAPVAPYAALYVGGMGLLGLARVLVAERCAAGRRWPAAAVAAAAVGQTVLIVAGPHTIPGLVLATVASAGALAVTLISGSLLRRPVTVGARQASEPAPVVAADIRAGTARAVESARAARGETGQPAAGGVALADPPAGREAVPVAPSATPAAPGQRPPRSYRTFWALTALVAIGIGLRLLVTRGLWLDEVTSLLQVQKSFGGMITDLRFSDVHPPAFHVLLWGWVRIAGTGDLAVRIPGIVLGTALIPLLYAAGRQLYDRRAGLVAAAIGTVAPILVWYAQEARMYTLFMLLATVAVMGQDRALRTGRARDWALYAIATAGLLWTQYFAGLFVVAQQLVFTAVAWRRWRDGASSVGPLLAGWSLSVTAVAASLLPLWPILSDQLIAYGERGVGLQQVPDAIGGTTASGPLIYKVGANLVWMLVGYHTDGAMISLVALWPLGLLLGLVVLGRARSGATPLLAVVALAPPLVLLALAGRRPDLFELRYFMGSVPPLLLMLGRLVSRIGRRRGAIWLATGVVLVPLALGLVDQQTNTTVPRRYDFRSALTELAAELDPGDVLLYEPSYLDGVVAHYARGVQAQPLRDALPPADGDGRIAVVGSFLEQPRHREVVDDRVATLRQRRGPPRTLEYTNVDVWIFE